MKHKFLFALRFPMQWRVQGIFVVVLASLLSTSFGCKLATPRDVNCFLIMPQHFLDCALSHFLQKILARCVGTAKFVVKVTMTLKRQMKNTYLSDISTSGGKWDCGVNNWQMEREGRWSSGHCTAACCNLQLSHFCCSATVSCFIVVVIIVLSATTQPPNRTKRGRAKCASSN